MTHEINKEALTHMSQTKPTVEIIPLKKKLEAGREHTMDVLVRIKSPEMETAGVKRPDLNLCVVLDRSGSMSGNKMNEAKQATKTCIDNMLPTDRLGCVTFDDHIEVLFPNQAVTDKGRLRNLVDRIVLGGSTALHGGWVKGGLEVTNEFKPDAVNRVLLVTDGQANVGECNHQVLCHQARELNARGVSTTTIGIGADFNEDLLIPMAEAGGGNSWHVKTPEDMVRIFDVELQGLVAQFGHTVTLGLKAPSGVEILDVINDFEKTPDGRHILPNLTAANDLDVVVRLRISERAEGILDSAVDVNLSFIGQSSGVPERVEANLSLEMVSAEEAAKETENAVAAEASLLLNNARDRRVAMDRLDSFDFDGARESLESMVRLVENRIMFAPSEGLAAELRSLRDEMHRVESRDVPMARKAMAFNFSSRQKGKFGFMEDQSEKS
jgi:Ca-activated chloride channel family protein